MITRLNKLIEEFKGCFTTDSAPDMLKASKLLDEIERLSGATGQRRNILEELYDFAETLKVSDKMKLSITNYKNVVLVKVPTRIPAGMLEEILNEVRQANDIVDVISQYVHLKRSGRNYFGYNDDKNTIIIKYRGLRDIYIEFDFEITEDILMEYLEFLDQLFS